MQQEVLTNTTSVADAYLSLLSDRGVDCIFANAGTDFAPIIEAFAKAQATGGKTPRCWARCTASRYRATSWQVNALVDATPISGPACV